MQNSEGIGFIDDVAVVIRHDMKFVKRALANSWDKRFPDAGAAARLQDVGARVPSVEAAYDRNFARVRGPHRKGRAILAVHPADVGAQPLVNAIVRAFIKEVQVLGTEQ